MAASTAPILVGGTLTLINDTVVKNKSLKEVGLRVPLFTGIAVLVFAGAEKVAGPVAPLVVGIAWVALITVLLTKGGPGHHIINFVYPEATKDFKP